jgi:hypothetical protein
MQASLDISLCNTSQSLRVNYPLGIGFNEPGDPGFEITFFFSDYPCIDRWAFNPIHGSLQEYLITLSLSEFSRPLCYCYEHHYTVLITTMRWPSHLNRGLRDGRWFVRKLYLTCAKPQNWHVKKKNVSKQFRIVGERRIWWLTNVLTSTSNRIWILAPSS